LLNTPIPGWNTNIFLQRLTGWVEMLFTTDTTHPSFYNQDLGESGQFQHNCSAENEKYFIQWPKTNLYLK